MVAVVAVVFSSDVDAVVRDLIQGRETVLVSRVDGAVDEDVEEARSPVHVVEQVSVARIRFPVRCY